METKFTKGKWVVGVCELVFAGDNIVADAGCSLRCQKEREANARLVAAAPELYEALVGLLALARNEGWSGTMIKNAESVLAKARGEAIGNED